MRVLLNLSKLQEVCKILLLVDNVVLMGDCTTVYRLAKSSGCMRYIAFFLCIEAEDCHNDFKSNFAKEEKPIQFLESIHLLDSRFPEFRTWTYIAI